MFLHPILIISITNYFFSPFSILFSDTLLATSYSDKGLHDEAEEIYSEVVDRFLSLKDTSAGWCNA